MCLDVGEEEPDFTFPDLSQKLKPVKCLLTTTTLHKMETIKRGLFPLHTSNCISGYAGTGKTYVVLWMLTEALKKKKKLKVYWADAEIGFAGWLHKVQSVKDAAEVLQGRVAYGYAKVPDVEDMDSNSILVLDSMTGHGCPPDGSDATQFIDDAVRPYVKQGSTVICIDHMAYNENAKKKPMIGHSSKLQAMQGSVLVAEAKVEFGEYVDGIIELTKGKDNTGALGPIRKDDLAVTLRGNPQEGFAIDVPKISPDGGKPKNVVNDRKAMVKMKKLIQEQGQGYTTQADALSCMIGSQSKRRDQLNDLVMQQRLKVVKVGHQMRYSVHTTRKQTSTKEES